MKVSFVLSSVIKYALFVENLYRQYLIKRLFLFSIYPIAMTGSFGYLCARSTVVYPIR